MTTTNVPAGSLHVIPASSGACGDGGHGAIILACTPDDPEGFNVAEIDLPNPATRDVYARLFAGSVGMASALYYLGGGSTYLEMHGRLCFCARQGKGADNTHATSCVDAFRTWQNAGSPIPHGEPVVNLSAPA